MINLYRISYFKYKNDSNFVPPVYSIPPKKKYKKEINKKLEIKYNDTIKELSSILNFG